MKTIFSGIKPTGRPHLGNYFGMIRQHLAMQEEGLVYAAIVDYHALNFIQNAEEMRALTRELIVDYLALGFDTEKHILFKQSDIPEHTELCWIFDTLMSVSYLSRAHAFKAALGFVTDSRPTQRDLSTKFEQLPESLNMGTMNYPMLMAADILLYDTDLVPVGQDQKQHIEFTRDTAEKFNRIFGETFKLPEDRILSEVETVPGTDGRKMSKSYGNTIPLFATDEEIEEKVMSIVTDSSGDVPQNVYAIHKLFKSESELANVYEENKGKYKNLKEILIADIKSFIAPLREKRESIAKDDVLIQKVIESGKERARAQASSKMVEVRRAIGVL